MTFTSETHPWVRNVLTRSTLMRNYLPVPQTWYIAMLAVNFVAAGELVPSEYADWEFSW